MRLWPTSAKVYIYGLREPGSREYRYVGATMHPEKRLGGHIATFHIEGGSRNQGPPPKSRWIARLWRNGVTPKLDVLEVCRGRTVAWEAEARTIARLLAGGHRLLNATRRPKKVSTSS